VRILIALLVAAALSLAAAVSLPSDATMFVTDGDGTIVGIGRTVSGETFELELLIGFEGFARLTVVTPAGEVVSFEVLIAGGVAYVDLVDLGALALEAGFTAAQVTAVDLLDEEAAGPDPRSTMGMHNASETGQEMAGDHPDERAYLGSGNADEDHGPPDELPVGPADPPVDPGDPPVDPEDPPVTPGRP
jgi:hypothetical protein